MSKFQTFLICLCLFSCGVDVKAKGKVDPQLRCLAKNIFHEARGESYEGKVAVALVTLNRVKSKKYPNTICKVVYQPHQFSWTAKEPRIHDWRLYHKIKALAYNVMTHNVISIIGDSKHYHARNISPYWAKKMKVVAKIDNHIFYK